jgi:hypothetical protein
MPGGQSSNSGSTRLSAFHLVISSLGVIAGVALAIYQIVTPSSGPTPVNVTVTVDPAMLEKNAPGTEVAKTEPLQGAGKTDVLLPGRKIDLSHARLLAALNDGSELKYPFRNLFDGRTETTLTLFEPDREINVLVDFAAAEATEVTGISYMPPASTSEARPVTGLDVMVLPDGQAGASGGQVYNFTLQTDQGAQSFALPPGLSGKAVWLRIAGAETTGKLAVGDFSLIGR